MATSTSGEPDQPDGTHGSDDADVSTSATDAQATEAMTTAPVATAPVTTATRSGNGAGDESGAPAESGRGYHLEIFVICFASLLLEISYTRIVSFKLFYYYTYLVIGLALLGIGTGSVVVSLSKRLRSASTDRIMTVGSLVAAVNIVLGYLFVARLPVASLAIWDYGTRDSAENLVKLVALCFVLFLSFVPFGIMISTLFSRRTAGINKLYFADLVGAGLACAVVVFMLNSIGPARTIMLAAAILAAVAVRLGVADRRSPIAPVAKSARIVAPIAGVLVVALLAGVVSADLLPGVRNDDDKSDVAGAITSRWSAIFRVDVIDLGDTYLLDHDGMLGSVIKRWDGDRASLDEFNFDEDARSFPFDLLGEPPEKMMIIGAAGGHEILASMYYGAEEIDAIELNPVTHELVTDTYADYNGHLAEQPEVNYENGDGRSYLARSDDEYDLVWYPAPDSYAASNAATAGAFVLSESYLYTSEAIEETLDHLTDDGILAAQFGESNYAVKQNRTTRYVATARHALEQAGIENPEDHILVSTFGLEANARLSTILVKKTPFTEDEIATFAGQDDEIAGSELQYAPGTELDNSVTAVATLPDDELDAYFEEREFSVEAITDDAPFFWHFARFSDVVANYGDPIDRFDPEDSIGERVILLLLAIATVMAAVFLLLPFVTMRKVWRKLPRKGASALYFTALGLGFMFFEISLIQRLILFLGYPTYSLTVTLASVLIFTGIGALLSARLKAAPDMIVKVLAPAIVGLAVIYLFLLPVLTDSLLTSPLAVRVMVAFLVLAPLGVTLGMFMPLGLGAVADLTDHSEEYVAWGWAVNGFASVLGSVLTTVIAMVLGFNFVLALSVVVYLGALALLRYMQRPLDTSVTSTEGAVQGAGGDATGDKVVTGNGDDTGTAGEGVAAGSGDKVGSSDKSGATVASEI